MFEGARFRFWSLLLVLALASSACGDDGGGAGSDGDTNSGGAGGTGDGDGRGDGDAEDTRDIAEALAAIDGMTVSEEAAELAGYRFFRLTFEQPVDHGDAAAGTFVQHMTLLHRDRAVPTVLVTNGYYGSSRARRGELATLLSANQLSVEHRFFAPSVPEVVDWSMLTVEQSANDHHRIVTSVRPLYSAPWVNTGASKGGMTAMYHRHFFPDDVDGTVAYVAPHSYGARDARYADFFADIGNETCRGSVRALQRELLTRREAMLALTAAYAEDNDLSFARIGGAEPAFEAAVLEVEWFFWQYGGLGACGALPSTDASDAALFDSMNGLGGLRYASDSFLDAYGPYFFQAHTELGYPAVERAHLADLLETDSINLEEGLPPVGAEVAFDAQPMLDVANWLATEASEIMLVYGEFDPYTAGAYELGDAADSHRFDVAGGTHGASISALSAPDRDAAFAVLQRWTGVAPASISPAQRPSSLTGVALERQRSVQRWLSRRAALER